MNSQVKDVSQSTNLYEIAKEIQQLNPGAIIRVGNMQLDPMATQRIFSSVPAEQLVLPEGFYYDEKDGINNKHNTNTIIVEDLAKADKSTLRPMKQGDGAKSEKNREDALKALQNDKVHTIKEIKKFKELTKKEAIRATILTFATISVFQLIILAIVNALELDQTYYEDLTIGGFIGIAPFFIKNTLKVISRITDLKKLKQRLKIADKKIKKIERNNARGSKK